ncbi:MAG: hypothetical protein ACXABY_16015 [Candidatus Thorarchaeota archaeon]|jgi:hypothetical protein
MNSQRLTRKWRAFRTKRVKNQISSMSQLSSYSAACRYFAWYLAAIAAERLDAAVELAGELSLRAEDWTKEVSLSLSKLNVAPGILTKQEWKHLDSILRKNHEEASTQLSTRIASADRKESFVLVGVTGLLDTIANDGLGVYDILIHDVDLNQRLLQEVKQDFASISCRSLYASLCARIPLWNTPQIEPRALDSKCEQLMENLWNSLKIRNTKKTLSFARRLKKFSRRAAVYRAQRIAGLQKQRSTDIAEKKKMKLLKEELKDSGLMKKRGLEYAVGLFYTSLLKTGNSQDIQTEFKEAERLTFSTEEATLELKSSALLENPVDYDGKLVTVNGQVSYLREKKSGSGSGEVVFTIFRLQDDTGVTEAYYPRYWLTDNGLAKNGYAEVTGVFNKLCKDAKRPDVHLTRRSLQERSEQDWRGRCEWLVRNWWDGFGNRTIANWTFGTLDMDEISTPSTDTESPSDFTLENATSEKIESVKMMYPSVRAGLRSLKSLLEYVGAKMSRSYARRTLSFYGRSLMVDALVYLAASFNLERSIKAKLPMLKTEINASGNHAYDFEQVSISLDREMNWLTTELDMYQRCVKTA